MAPLDVGHSTPVDVKGLGNVAGFGAGDIVILVFFIISQRSNFSN